MSLTSLIRTECGKDVKKIGFFGFGISNRKIAELLISETAPFKFTYRSSRVEKDIPTRLFGSRCRIGEAAYTDITEDVIFLSPSVRRPESFMLEAKRAGCRLLSDAELFFLTKPKGVIAITGSDGKSTVTYLTARLTEASLGAVPSGNFGLPLTTLIGNKKSRGAVVELSSFQLQYMAPHTDRALITNITENHLNWHSSLEEYIEAKKNIFKNSKKRAITLDGEMCEAIAKELMPEIIISDLYTARQIAKLYAPELILTLENGYINVNGTPYISLDDIRLKETYNVKNFMSAIAMSWGLTDRDSVLALARDFHGLPHRKELVAERGGISFINSSIDSTPTRTAKTLSTLDTPAIVIIGGASKGLSYEPLIAALKEHARAIVLTGASAPTLYQLLSEIENFEPSIYLEADFYRAVELSVRIAKPTDTVILSPAHTSYDCFENFEARGNCFKEIIKNIIE